MKNNLKNEAKCASLFATLVESKQLFICLPKSVIDKLQYVQNRAARLMTRTRSSEHTGSSKTTLATSQTTNYLQNTTSYLQRTEWHGAKVYSRSSSVLHSDEAIAIFFKKFACNTEVEP